MLWRLSQRGVTLFSIKRRWYLILNFSLPSHISLLHFRGYLQQMMLQVEHSLNHIPFCLFVEIKKCQKWFLNPAPLPPFLPLFRSVQFSLRQSGQSYSNMFFLLISLVTLNHALATFIFIFHSAESRMEQRPPQVHI